jgi:hypothetical protein
VAIAVLLLDQVPPEEASLKDVLDPEHTAAVPVTGGRPGITVMVCVAGEPQPVEYEIIEVPAVTPVVTPPASTVAVVLLLLLQTPAKVGSVKVAVFPAHKVEGPVIADGVEVTVIGFSAEQLPMVYEIVAVPVPIAVTVPEPLTFAMALLLVCQPPPPLVSPKLTVPPPKHAREEPVMGAGCVLTAKLNVCAAPQPVL